MLRALRTAAFTVAPLLLGSAAGLAGQTVEDPLVPRGSLVFRADPVGTTVKGLYGPEGTGEEPLGDAFRISPLGAEHIPSLVPVGERFEMLAGSDESADLRLGATTARFTLDERVLPLQLSYGILERLTVGVTVPFVRKEIQPSVRLAPDGANVGRNPSVTAAGEVSGFMGEAEGALGVLEAEVDETCSLLGEGSAECQDGRALVGDTDGFLSELSGAYDEEAIFPTGDSSLGTGITSHWSSLIARFQDWDTQAPTSTLPLASGPLDQQEFESLYLTPAWGPEGFPLDRGQPLLALGDVEAHVAVGLLRPPGIEGDSPSATTEGVHVVASAVGTIRFATGAADSLHVVAPLHPPRGVSGFGARLVTDVLLPGRFAVLGTLEAGWNGSADVSIVAPDPQNLFRAGFTRTEATWSPGSHIRAALVPRFRLGPGLSLGAGWHLLRKEPDAYEPISEGGGGSEGPSLPLPGPAYTQHRLGLELRYAAMRAPLADSVWFPFELMVRASRTVSGTEGAPVETKAEATVRFRLRDW